MKNQFDLIEVNPHILLGKPVIKGTRIPVYVVVNLVAQGKSITYIRKNYPRLTAEDVQQALAYAAWTTNIIDETYHLPHV